METKELILGGLANVKRSLDRALNTLTPEEMQWQAKPDANSIQLILLHMARAEDSSLNSRILKKTDVWETENWYGKLKRDIKDSGAHYTAEQVASFTVSDVKELLAYAEAVRAKTLEFVKALSEEEASRKITLPAFGPPPAPGAPPRPPMEVAIGSLLLMTVTHLAQHAGEISYIRGLKRGMDK